MILGDTLSEKHRDTFVINKILFYNFLYLLRMPSDIGYLENSNK